ncbi:N-acetylmuramoyl-L-alanine amidase family protein [Thermaerobacter subterraneus]|uniref:N-acetylmuramoyl-L-alanine amidase n=1 Tax=Thermaerobacter subterraneus DSM 13965 TaxID=867903 RepID=K6QCT7_9FIRM|nr:N-acetylmuramoyl-L-alanine amidase [Thermaerobacter subterraneus]EKP94391.1 N-acetylmuramoyl-L-alanine amidase [Thermaerobacter subterraneus DSM 13965]
MHARRRHPGPVRDSGGETALLAVLAAVLVLVLLSQRAHAPAPSNRDGPVIVLDPGHGGIDGGTHLQGRILEKDLTLQLAQAMAPLLEASGFRVVLTRTADYALAPGDDDASVRRDLEERLRITRDARAAALVSLHVNAARDSRLRGPIVFYQFGDEPGRRLALAVQASLNAAFPPEARNEALPADFFLLAKAGRPAVLVEFAFLTNPADRAILLSPQGRRHLAAAAVEGLVRGLAQLGVRAHGVPPGR